jgi:nitroreductase
MSGPLPLEVAGEGYRAVVDHALTTTRGVRMRLDFGRDVDDATILDCIDVAEQAPTGGNNGSRRWMVVRDQATKDRMAELYLSAGVDWVIETARRLEGSGHQNERMMAGARRLGENLARAPVLVVPTIIGRHDGSGRPGLFDSVIQAAWSFMVALRARGLGTVWTTMVLNEADAVAELLDLPDDVTQICLFPVAYTFGTDFSPTRRRYPAREITYFDRYGRTLHGERHEPRTLDGAPGVMVELDVKARPETVWTVLDELDPAGRATGAATVDEVRPPQLLAWHTGPDDEGATRHRLVIERVPGGSRLRLGTTFGAGPSALAEAIAARPAEEAALIAAHQDEQRAAQRRFLHQLAACLSDRPASNRLDR